MFSCSANVSKCSTFYVSEDKFISNVHKNNTISDPPDKKQYSVSHSSFSFPFFHYWQQKEGKTIWVRLTMLESMFQAFWRCTDADQDYENLYKADWASQFIDSNSTITNMSLELPQKSMIHKVKLTQAVNPYQWLHYCFLLDLWITKAWKIWDKRSQLNKSVCFFCSDATSTISQMCSWAICLTSL